MLCLPFCVPVSPRQLLYVMNRNKFMVVSSAGLASVWSVMTPQRISCFTTLFDTACVLLAALCLSVLPHPRQLLYVMNPNKFMVCQYLIDWHERIRGDKVGGCSRGGSGRAGEAGEACRRAASGSLQEERQWQLAGGGKQGAAAGDAHTCPWQLQMHCM